MALVSLQQRHHGRLKAHGVTRTPTVLTFPNAGHFVGGALAYTPLTDEEINGSGGTVIGNAVAMAQAHQELLRWLSHQ